MIPKLKRRMLWLGLFALAAAGGLSANPGAASAEAGICADDGGTLPRDCTKEVRIYNNTARQIWVVFQGSIQLTDALSCPRGSAKGGGDVWLQVALGRDDDCMAVKSDYYVFINPAGGIRSGEFATINVPWWSKLHHSETDRYVDWWRGARVILFDDRSAMKEVFVELKKSDTVRFAGGSPKPNCKNQMAGNACNHLKIYEVPPGKGISPHLPFQLNEFTFADICKVNPDGTFLQVCEEANPGGFIDFNQNYNVSNVDQVYLPLAMEPVRNPPDVGYMGTTMSVKRFRKQLTAFTNADDRPSNPDWPVYNNPDDMFPKAGIRVPSAQSVMAFYMDPWLFPDGESPGLIPAEPPKMVHHMMNQWEDCTGTVTSCAEDQAANYKAVNAVFLKNYKRYVDTCPADRIPDYLKPVSNNPPMPKLSTYLTFIYGWVPFNVACPNDELPVADDPPPGSRSVLDYFAMQYNFEELGGRERQWFNPYTQLIHDDYPSGGLNASAYAFSIDDHASFLSNSGGSLRGGLIFAVGGKKGLRNGKRHAPPVPAVYKWYNYSIGLGAPSGDGPFWKKYGICSTNADTKFPTEIRDGFVLGVDPAVDGIGKDNRCPITLLDTAGRKYRIVVKKAQAPGIQLPQKAIWPAFEPTAGAFFDPAVVACPDKAGLVDPDRWCEQANQVSRPSEDPNQPGFYTIGAPPPLDNADAGIR
ncbi:hypothetical protein [Microbaculum marinum]|uniref:Uncharacterized protein n=1 Tax=Microbaculum marinum TaxID=1764581 RepID=A0AAW9RUI8_9HYPH